MEVMSDEDWITSLKVLLCPQSSEYISANMVSRDVWTAVSWCTGCAGTVAVRASVVYCVLHGGCSTRRTCSAALKICSDCLKISSSTHSLRVATVNTVKQALFAITLSALTSFRMNYQI